MDIWYRVANLGGLIGLVLTGDECLGAAVIDDVCQFVARQATRAGRVDKSCIVAAPNHFEESRMIFQADGDVITNMQSTCAQ